MPKSMRLLICITLAVSFWSGSTGHALGAHAEPAVPSSNATTVAILAPLTGVPHFGRSARDGALLALEQQNASGGILGMPVAWVVEDTACDSGMAAAAAARVIDQAGARYIIGDVCSGSSIAISALAEAAGVIQISPSATHPLVTTGADGRVKNYIYRAAFIDPVQAAAGARFARTALSAQRAYVLGNPDDAYSQGLADAFVDEFSKSGIVAGQGAFSDQTDDFSAILADIAGAQADLVYFPAYGERVNRITAQAKQLGMSLPFIGGDAWDSPSLDLASASGSYFTSHFSLEDTRPEVRTFELAFRGRFGYAPDMIAPLAYDAARVLLQAMLEAGSVEPDRVRAKMTTLAHRGVTGPIVFDEFHNPIKSVPVLQVTEGGVHFTALVPADIAQPVLAIDYPSGSPGSTFRLTGSNYPPNRTATVIINGQTMADTIPVDAEGAFVAQLSTAGAAEGRYSITVSVNPRASCGVTLDEAAPARTHQGNESIVVVPPGIANTRAFALPLVAIP